MAIADLSNVWTSYWTVNESVILYATDEQWRRTLEAMENGSNPYYE